MGLYPRTVNISSFKPSQNNGPKQKLCAQEQSTKKIFYTDINSQNVNKGIFALGMGPELPIKNLGLAIDDNLNGEQNIAETILLRSPQKFLIRAYQQK